MCLAKSWKSSVDRLLIDSTIPHRMRLFARRAVSRLNRLTLCWFLFAALFAIACGTVSAEEPNLVAELSRDSAMAKKLGLQKLSQEERDEWNRLLTTAHLAGVTSGGTNQNRLGDSGAQSSEATQKKGALRLWLSKADLESDEVVKLDNGAVFNISSGSVGVGIRREVALIEDGSRWSLWISRKRVYRGELLRAPENGKPITFSKATISSVSQDGSLLTMLDSSIYEIELLGRIHTMLWLPATEVFVLENGKMLNASDSGGELIDCRRLK